MENYKNINPVQQLTKQGVDETTGQKKTKKIYPVSITRAIYDEYTKNSLYNILNRVNCIYVKFKTDIATTRLSVELGIRKQGLIIVYVRNALIYAQIYIHDYIMDDYWKSDFNWRNVSIEDNILLGYEQTGENYPLQIDGNKKAFVNVPGYSLPVADTNRLGGVKENVESPITIDNNGLMNLSVADMEVQNGVLNPYQIVSWGETSDINTFVTRGTYRLTGQRTNAVDNLPVEGIGSANTIDCRLFVLDSSVSGTTQANKSKCITQILFVSNRNNANGYVYIRTGHATSKNELTGGAGWSDWDLVNRHNATQESDGYMSKEDKTKLDNLTGATLKIVTQVEYDNIETKDDNTVYFIK